MAEDNKANDTSNSSKTSTENTTEKQTDMPGKEFKISHVQDSKDKKREPRIQG
jgi:hypothetical protein